MSTVNSSITHEVTNQVPPLENYNLYEHDIPLQECIQREGGHWGIEQIRNYGQLAGSDLLRWGFQANENLPKLKSFDRYGHRIDEVEFHPAYHQIMQTAFTHGLHSLPWEKPIPGAHVVRSALYYLHGQVEQGTGCPTTMTFACIPTLKNQPNVAEKWIPNILTNHYDPRCIPAEQKTGLTIGMAMTEKQGGSDVRANTTRAYPIGQSGPGQAYELVGHKWFCSAPMCDAFLVLAQTEVGLSCFLLPRWRPDGTRNPFYVQRLKDKLGNKSNASSEVEFNGTYATMIGEEGRGVPTIIEMVSLTRFDCMLGSAAPMRQALSQALHHTSHRKSFGNYLIDQPLMQNVLADLALESEAATVLAFRVARALDETNNNEQAKSFVRIATAIGKYWICKRAPAHINEAQECLGGAGYVEETILPRLYREAPLNSIWEGCGNIQCLDVLRALAREPGTLDTLMTEIKLAAGENKHLDNFIQQLESNIQSKDNIEQRARFLVEQFALALQGSLLVQTGNSTVADAFCAARLTNNHGLVYGTLPNHIDFSAIIDRAKPLL